MNKRFRKKKRENLYYLKVAVIGVIIATFFWFSFISKKLSDRIISIASVEANQRFYNMTSKIIREQVKKENVNDFLVFTKNKDGELLLTKYNLSKVYDFLEKVSNYLELDKNYVFFLPSGLISKKFLINNIGTKIPIRVIIANGIYVNIKTKITNYGINNALAEIYLIIEAKQVVVSPFEKKEQIKQYELLLSSFFITGKIPNFYGDRYELSSNIFDIKEKI